LEVELGAAEDYAIIDARGGENPLEVLNPNSKIQAIFIISLISVSRNFTGIDLRAAA